MSQPSRRSTAIGLLSAGIVLLVAVGAIGVWLAHSFLASNRNVITLAPDAVQQSRMADTPPVARNTVRANPSGSSPSFTGTVIDANTKQPIQEFTVRLGYSYPNIEHPFYNSNPTKTFHGGNFKVSSRIVVPSSYHWHLRFDAPGYYPQSVEMSVSTGAVNVGLEPGKDIQGTVLDAAGAPVAGANIAMAVPGVDADIDPNALSNTQQYGFNATSGADGTFKLPPQRGEVAIVAMSDKGFARIDQDAGSEVHLKLAQWGRLEGSITIAGKPGTNAQITLDTSLPQAGPMSPRVYVAMGTQADAQGLFHLDRVMPGSATLAREVTRKYGTGTTTRRTMTQEIEIAAGTTTKVKMGGVGRAVIGKLVLPAGTTLSNYYINENINGVFVPPPATLPSQMPANVRNGTQMTRDMWMGLFSLTAAGKDFLALHPNPRPIARQYSMEFADDGNFRIEDVAPGDYQMYIYPNATSGGRNLMSLNTSFTVPEVPGGGYSDDPVNLGDLKFPSR